MGELTVKLFLLVTILDFSNTDIFSAICKLEALLVEEEKLLVGLEKYINAQQKDDKEIDERIIK